MACLVLVTPAHADETKARKPDYPETRRTDVFEMMHGEKVLDPYRWLELDRPRNGANEAQAAEVEAWDREQHELLRETLDGYPRREEIRKLLDAEYGLGNMRSLPRFEGGRMWFTYRPKDANQSVLYVADEDGSNERVVLDPNRWSEDGTENLAAWEPSPDGKIVAYRRGTKGSEATTMYFRDVATGKDLPDQITRTKFSAIAWTPDGKGVLYTRMPDPESVPAGEVQHHRRLYFHELGTLPIDDRLVAGRGANMLRWWHPYRTADRKGLMLVSGLPYKFYDTYELDYTDGAFALRPLRVGVEDRTLVDRVGDTFVMNSDRDRGERNIFATKTRKPDGTLGEWTKMFDGVDGVISEESWIASEYVICIARANIVSELWVQHIDWAKPKRVGLPGPGTVSSVSTQPGSTNIWFSFESYSEPKTTYRCDLAVEGFPLTVIERLPTSLDVDNLVSTQTTYPSKDGTQIPVFLVHRKDVKLDGSAPTVLYGYGGFRAGMYPYFSRMRGIWAALGGVTAIACLRGGDEFGEAWHQAGCLGNKQNVYDDFIAGADWLVSSGKTSRDRLAIQGGSNGGLLVAVCVNQRPDLCRAGISGVPLTDMLRFHRFQYAKSWTKEYGDPDVKEHFEWIRAYSPYHNVEPAAYPAMLVTAGFHDGRVDAFHARKMVAQWQHHTTSHRPILLMIDRDSGHGSSSLIQLKDESTDKFAFLLMQLGGSE